MIKLAYQRKQYFMTGNANHHPLPKRWEVHHPIPQNIDRELKEFPPLLRQLLYNRGFTTSKAASAFINGQVDQSTDPFQLKDMTVAVERLHQAIISDEKIAVYGDYDADGVTATALLIEFFSALGVDALAYIPNRYDEGYGLNDDALRQLAGEGIRLVITVDCGIRSVTEVALANQLGLDVIISDHHQPGDLIPDAAAVIDPKQPDDHYPYDDLAGVGLAYKLTQAYLSAHPHEGVNADDWLDLVAIGTVADLAPLVDENRVLVKKGLEKIRQKPRQGLYSLASAAGIDLAKCDASNIGFGLGPRLNAAGRLDSALSALTLLTTQDLHEAGHLAQQLDTFNKERQDMTHQIREKASEKVLAEDPDAVLFFAADPEFSEGVVGLAASRLTESFYRPAIIGHQGEKFTVASCRSIPEFHITRALDACADLLVRHGGHAAAAGFTVRNEDCDALVSRLRQIAQDQLGTMELLPVLDIDREIQLDKVEKMHVPVILDDLHHLEPTGRGNPEPVFASKGVKVYQVRTVGKDDAHLKLILRAGSKTYDAIAFRQGYWAEDMPELVDIAYRFEVNEYNGRSTLQLNVKDIRAAE